MRERSELLLKLLCIVLGGLIIVRLARVAINGNPLAHATIPALPSLSENSEPSTMIKTTNAVKGAPALSTNKTAVTAVSNSTTATLVKTADVNTNKAAANALATSSAIATNVAAISNSGPPAITVSNVMLAEEGALKATNNSPAQGTATNSMASGDSHTGDSNSVTKLAMGKTGTNLAAAEHTILKTNSNQPSKLMKAPVTMGRLVAQKSPELSAAIRARIDRITDSEILGQVIRPMPTALLGIAGNTAFLRSANGQTGLVKEGDELGGLKLLRIGINRVLVEEDGQKKELMIFSGYGGESLLAKTPDTTNEHTNNLSNQRASK